MSISLWSMHNMSMTSIFCSHKDANHLVSIVNNELAKIFGLKPISSLNLTKTNFMIFQPRQKKISVNVPLTLDNTVIKQVTETNFLGVLIDQHLSWKPRVLRKLRQPAKIAVQWSRKRRLLTEKYFF